MFCLRSGSGRGLEQELFQCLYRGVYDINGDFVILPYPHLVVDLEAVPSDRRD